jgi:polar amino acid transport system substrate-binding protein
LLSTLLIGVFLSSSLCAAEQVTMGVLLFPPDITIDEKTKRCVGRNIDITRKLLLEYGVTMQVVCASPMRIYRMIEDSEVDLTINIKSTKALASHVEFSKVPFRKLVLNMYSHSDAKEFSTISAVRGFDYQGYRENYSKEGFEFIDLPSTISAIQVFIKHRSDYLLSYESPVLNFTNEKKLLIPDTVSVTPLLEIDTFYAISNKSIYLDKLKYIFNDYALKHNAHYFLSDLQDSSPQ